MAPILYGKAQMLPRLTAAPTAAIMDINGFKKINDTYGHYEGDRALIETANILKKAIGGTPMFLARYGGDEFAILGFLKDMNEAEGLKKKIQRYFADSNVDVSRIYDITMGGFQIAGCGWLHIESGRGFYRI